MVEEGTALVDCLRWLAVVTLITRGVGSRRKRLLIRKTDSA